MRQFYFLALLTYSFTAISQSQIKRVLFIGNSYTNVNNLPSLLANVALSTGDSIIYDSNTPGGYTFQGHINNQTTLNKIAQGNWDYVVLQEQSQRPSFPDGQVQTYVYPYAKLLDSLINDANPCTETVFYMTWGRKNGDVSYCQSFPPVCTYQGMDSVLNLRYRHMADTNKAIVSPVGAVWNYIRATYPTIELYSADESHPSLAGSYAAACTFYATILRKDPTLITFNSNLSAAVADQIKSAAKLLVYDSLLNWHIGEYDANAQFTSNQNGFQFQFFGSTDTLVKHLWDFGDGTMDSVANPIHTYSSLGYYYVTHTVSKCSTSDIDSSYANLLTISLQDRSFDENKISIYPNPSRGIVTINPGGERVRKVTVYSLNGVEVKVIVDEQSLQQINLRELNSGCYFLKLELDEGNYSLKKVVMQ